MSAPSVVVVGQLARDLVLVVDAMPAPGTAADVRSRREVLGGKGANQAVGLAQLGVPVRSGRRRRRRRRRRSARRSSRRVARHRRRDPGRRAATVRHPGGRPDLTPATMAACLAEVNAALDRASP